MSFSRVSNRRWQVRAPRLAAFLAVVALLIPSLATGAAAADAPTLHNGDTVYVGDRSLGYGGTELQSVYYPVPSDEDTQADPEFWAYCIEHDIPTDSSLSATVGDFDSYLGDNHFSDPVVQAKVLWVLAHSYPAMTLAAFGTASGVPGISENDAIEAAQYAIWRYTDLNFDADWNWETQDSEDAYWYLVGGANADGATTPPTAIAPTVSVTAPSGAQVAGSLVGPFVVHTNQPTAAVTVDPSTAVVDVNGDPLDATALADGAQFYLDLRDATAAGNATVTASVPDSSSTGKVISLPAEAGQAPTAADHAQSHILVAPSTATTSAQAAVEWGSRVTPPVPSIDTTLVDASDGDHSLAWDGGTLTDTVTYQSLIPGTEYTVSGTLMKKSDGSSTGLTGSATFTPTEANGSVDVVFVVPEGHAGEELVAFESLIVDGGLLATHEDIDDAAQTVAVDQAPVTPQAPSLGTTLVDASDSDHTLAWDGGTLTDTVTYQNLVPGTEYTVSGTLMRKSDSSNTGITGAKTFTPTEANGTVDVSFDVPKGYADDVLVAFESLTAEGSPDVVASHADINDADQSVTVEEAPPTTPTDTPTTDGPTTPGDTPTTDGPTVPGDTPTTDGPTMPGDTPGASDTGTAATSAAAAPSDDSGSAGGGLVRTGGALSPAGAGAVVLLALGLGAVVLTLSRRRGQH